jgi:hydroxymethylglutaryl-CoA lyase
MTQITISEVGPRDGLQSVETILSTEGKLAWIEAEYGAGVREIEVGSFVSPKLLPQMADTAAGGQRRAPPQRFGDCGAGAQPARL